MEFEKLAIQIPTICLPNRDVDLTRWAVIACDQYTSEPEYWSKVDRLVGEAPSTLRVIFPEVFLEHDNADSRIAMINRTMTQYLEDGTIVPLEPGFILVDRQTEHMSSRKGLVVALDLEHYDYRPGAKTLIRATEGTIVDRLPPRIKVRENAAIELPHIMVLIDDPDRTVIEPLFDESLPQVYDFDLMLGGGRLRGWQVSQPQLLGQVARSLEQLTLPERTRARYGGDGGIMLYAMGDGNHSFATAKAIWDRIKRSAGSNADIMSHPARHALVELVNVHDPGLEFEPIHRLLFEVDANDVLAEADNFYRRSQELCQLIWPSSLAEAVSAAADCTKAGAHAIPFVMPGRFGLLQIDNPKLTMVVATLQNFLDAYLQDHPRARIDYIHGDATVSRLGQQQNAMGFYLPAISKHDLFRTIVRDGALPRKTFSMGEADEKRFYLEARRITR